MLWLAGGVPLVYTVEVAAYCSWGRSWCEGTAYYIKNNWDSRRGSVCLQEEAVRETFSWMNLSSLQRIHVYPHTLTHLLLFYIEYGKKIYIQCNKPSNETRRGFWIFDGESGTSALLAMAGWWKRQVWHCPDQFSEPPTRNHEPWLLSSLSLCSSTTSHPFLPPDLLPPPHLSPPLPSSPSTSSPCSSHETTPWP